MEGQGVVKGLSCPACGGPLGAREGVEVLSCAQCATTLRVRGPEGLQRFYVPKKLARAGAEEKVKAWFRGWNKATDLAATARVEDAFLVFIPFWRVAADVLGWVFGQKKHTRRVKDRTETYYTDEEKEVRIPYDTTLPACEVAEFGVKWVNLSGDEVRPVDFEALQQDGMVFEPTLSATDALAWAEKEFLERARGQVGLDRVTHEELYLVRERRSVVYYPLWVFRYKYQGRIYQVVIDAEDGSLAYGKAPGNNAYRAGVFTAAAALGSFLLSLLPWTLAAQPSSSSSRSDDGGGGAAVAEVLAGGAAIAAGYRVFRYGGEVEEGTGREKGRASGGILDALKGLKLG